MVKDFSYRKIPSSFRYAARGLWHVLRTEQNVKIHFFVSALVLAAALWLQIPAAECAILLLAIGLVITAEVINTIIEDFLDILHPAHHEAVRRIKDALAGAVLLSAGVAVFVGILIILPRLVAALFGSAV